VARLQAAAWLLGVPIRQHICAAKIGEQPTKLGCKRQEILSP
jgi:hypothetical protein